MANRLDLNDRGSFLDDENQMLIDATVIEIGQKLFEDWNSSNLDEGTFYADQQIAILSDDPYLKDKFNKFYELSKDDDDFLN
jgi:hypothetical protein